MKTAIAFLASTYIACAAYAANQVSQYGITWIFDKDYEIGQFINGDYYVVDPGEGVKITSVSPKPGNGKNGSMINPRVGPVQGYDSNVHHYDAESAARYPVTLDSGNSLVSTISLTENDSINGYYVPNWTSDRISENQAALKTAAVLTVLDRHPPPGTFRPPFIGNDKPQYNFSEVNTNVLPKLHHHLATDTKKESLTRGLQRPWLTHLPGWTCRKMHPIENMKNYHEYIGVFLSEASTFALTDHAHGDFLVNYIQTGIDLYYMSIDGYGDSAFFKWPVIFTGLLLDNEDMQNVFVENRNKTPGRTEKLFYFWKDKESTIESKIVPPGQTYSGQTVFFRKQIGDSEYEHLHPSEWGLVANGGGYKQEKYRHCCDSHPHIGMILCAQILKKTELWNDEAAIAYADRWMNEKDSTFLPIITEAGYTISTSSGETGSSFVTDMWLLYRYSEPPPSPSDLNTKE
ncbi:hypothetical protein QEH56_23235 [Pelagicoccus enzymogenes]|uniref:hypothetical protein n=1 Tax=Pelagicoccus enzymogenes TaxID=2773457 RepID=UPI00280FF3D7|nr:hypothetical protein [Pelagicoccus enzymogenes]MDQ8201099.1 hypothetical protein [Pelagicoccus enzymogenes]